MNPCLQDRAFELLVVFMISTSVLGLTTALMGWFRPEGVFAFGLVSTFIYQQGLRYFGVSIQKKRIGLGWLYILAILLMGAFFRIPPYHCILGGQDQGVYVNIASSIERTGTVTAVDPVLDRMAGPHHERYVQDNYGSSQYLPGVFRTREASGNVGVEFQFYHLFPVWMAIFEGIFGSESGVYALTFMSMVSLLLCYWLVRILTESDTVAFAAALLLTLNPLHAFFSKFPVTEVPALAFSLAGFSCFAAYWVSADRQGAGNGRFLVLSALSFGCLFTTRISGFFYMPTLFVLFAAVLLREESRNIRNAVAFWAFLVFLLYGISVWYGLTWSANYSHWIYSHSFSKVFGKGWPIGVSVVAVAMSVAFVCILVATKIERLRKFLASILAWLSGKLGLMFALIMIAGGYKLYQFAFTDTYAGNPWLGERWELAGRGLGSVAVSSLAATTLYVSPMIVMVFVYFMLLKFKDGPIHLTKFFLLSLFTYIALLNFVIPYHPYYARYLLSELVPYMIVFVVWGWSLTAHGSKRNIVAMLLVAAALYSGTLSFLQVGNAEQRGAYEGLSRIASQVGENDLILLHGKDLYGEIKTPLVYKFGKNVISISDDSMLDRAYMSFLLDSFEDVYLLSSGRFRIEGLQCLAERGIEYDSYRRTPFPPVDVVTRRYDLFLYGGTWSWVKDSSLETTIYPMTAKVRTLAFLRALGNGWHGIEKERVWSKATADLMLPVPEGCRFTGCSVKIVFSVFGASLKRPVEVYFAYDTDDGRKQKQITRTNNAVTSIHIPLPRAGTTQNVTVRIPEAVSPSSLGGSGDTRVLGIALRGVELVLP